MPKFHTSLQREKFKITDLSRNGKNSPPVMAFSNRMPILLQTKSGAVREDYVVRAHNMHTCIKLAAYIVKEFETKGPISGRSFNWSDLYEEVVKGYEKKWNKDLWVAIYHDGEVLFKGGSVESYPMLDIIEQCDFRNKKDYDNSVELAKKAYKKAGKNVDIEHEVNVAMVFDLKPKKTVRCGMVARGSSKRRTFSYMVDIKNNDKLDTYKSLLMSAALLEGIQLAFLIGVTKKREKEGLLSKISPEIKKSKAASEKLGRVTAHVRGFNKDYDVKYRPEQPDFSSLVDEAMEFMGAIIEMDAENVSIDGV